MEFGERGGLLVSELYQEVKRLTQNIDAVIEKSPPNMMRMEELASKKVSFIANNRDPPIVQVSLPTP